MSPSPGAARPKAVLLDIGGTLHVDRAWLPGAREAVLALRRAGVQVRFVTNLTQHGRGEVVRFLADSGLPTPEAHVLTAGTAAARWLAGRGAPRVLALARGGLLDDLRGSCVLVDAPPADWVLVADMGDELGADRLNQGLRALLQGAGLLGMERNRFYQAADGPRLDSGPVLAALEFASGKAATAVFGKPDAGLFGMALDSAGARPEEALMVGDDLEMDVIAPLALGLRTALVRTGKFRPGWDAEASARGAWVLNSVAELPGRLGLGGGDGA